jgi:hypothetical protein
MNIKNLNDQLLVQKAEGLVKEEREVLTNLLHYFREIERRRLYCDYHYSSLHKMLVGHFGYSDDEAYRRTSAMRLLKELPEVEEKINNGELSLSHLSLAQTFFQKEVRIHKLEISKEDKLELLSEISEQPIREAQRIVFSQSSAPEELRPDKITVISEEKVEYRFTADKLLEFKISELKGLLAHKYPHLSLGELLEILCDLGIEMFKNEKTTTSQKPYKEKSALHIKKSAPHMKPCSAKTMTSVNVHDEETNTSRKPCNTESLAQIKREVWQESQHECSNCHSKYALEMDHLHPKAKGGGNTKENLRILCRACNQRAAIREFGQIKMDLYLN